MPGSSHVPERSPRALPMLNPPEALRAPMLPHYLGWVNYGSSDTTRAIRIPAPSRDVGLLTRSRRTASGVGRIAHRCATRPRQRGSPGRTPAGL
ncbi:DUF5953 family protein [Corallococcus exiguus]|uniref:DUF5953 family protein n=1 Tax=Corallococcus exiguus TaxID=83462 RepID=UPI0027B902B9|nr:DUF5953 family protein [Corallococcus exiguus]